MLGIINKIKLLSKECLDSRLVEKTLVTMVERYKASIILLGKLQGSVTITLTKLLHILQVQEQQRLKKEDGVVEGILLQSVESAFEVRNYKRSKYNQNNSCFSVLSLLQ